MAKVTVIPAIISKENNPNSPLIKPKRKVAAYARVSTEEEMQTTSYDAQVEYYENYIKNNPEWQFVGVYKDHGISGTGIKNRVGFNDMIKDALNGKIDLIITKSVSRFARNTVDSLVTIRKLKEKGIEVFFETENIYTLDKQGELMLTILSSIAQEESRHISENVTWGKRKSMKDGKVTFAYSSFLGYDKDKETGKLVINEEQAKIVKFIYLHFMRGESLKYIAKQLDTMNAPTPMRTKKWHNSTVLSILTNEKYRGDAMLQKYYTKNYLTHEVVINKNDGVVPLYYVEGHHEPIIAPEEWDAVQEEVKRRKNAHSIYSAVGPFSGKLICADCGNYYGPKLWHSTDEYKKTIYQCNYKFKNKRKCKTPNLSEEQIKELFVKAYNEFMHDKAALKEDCKLIIETIDRREELKTDIEEIKGNLGVIENIVKKLVKEGAENVGDTEAFDKKYKSYEEKHKKLVEKLEAKQGEFNSIDVRIKKIESFLNTITSRPGFLKEFNEELWFYMVESGTVNRDGSIKFKFRVEKEIIVK